MKTKNFSRIAYVLYAQNMHKIATACGLQSECIRFIQFWSESYRDLRRQGSAIEWFTGSYWWSGRIQNWCKKLPRSLLMQDLIIPNAMLRQAHEALK